MRLRRRPYAGPPSYGRGHPDWGFPPVIWRSATITGTESATHAHVRGLLVVAALAGLTTLACLVAAGAEVWRFTLMLAGRTQVLPGGPVHASDVMVLSAGIAALVLGVVTALGALPVLVTLHRAAAERAGRAPSRSAALLLARLVVPGWNLHGAGQILVEIARGLRAVDARRRSTRVTVPLWWLAWVINGLLVLATLIMAFGRSNQMIADTVLMHVVVDVVGAVVAGLFAAILVSFERAWRGRGSRRYAGWSVRPPESTARNRIAADPEQQTPTDLEGPTEMDGSADPEEPPEPEQSAGPDGGSGSGAG